MILSTKIKKVTTALIAAASLVTLSACAAQNPGNSMEEGFSLLSSAMAGDSAAPGHGHMQGNGGGHGGHHMMMGMLMKDLNLTDAQKAQFKALMQEGKGDHMAMRGQMKGFKEKLKTQFLSDNFDSASLKAELAQVNKPNASDMANTMAQKMVSAWQILTPEQQNQLEAKMSQMEEKFAKWEGKAPAHGGQGKHLERLKSKLNLSDAQVQQLSKMKQSNQPERTEKMAQMRQLKNQVLAQLKAGASAEQIAATLAPVTHKMGHGFDKQLEKMQAFHDVLTPAQRQQMVEMMQQRGKHHAQHGGQHRSRGK